MAVVVRRLRIAGEPLMSQLSRKYGSAAAMDYDYYEQQYGINNCNTIPEVPSRGVQWVVLGHPMARRHVYAHKLSQLLDVPHISMSSLLRQELHPLSSLYNKIASAVNQGRLVPEDVIFDLLSKRLEEGYNRGETGFILDGIPRSTMQAEILDQMADIDLVVNIKCTEEPLLKHHLGNGLSFVSQELYDTAKCRFSLDIELPENVMTPSSIDSQASRTEKYLTYMKQNKPSEDYYRKQRKLLDFHVAGAPGDCWKGLLSALHLQHMNTNSASQKLTA